jgi:hypothetical protein
VDLNAEGTLEAYKAIKEITDKEDPTLTRSGERICLSFAINLITILQVFALLRMRTAARARGSQMMTM